MKNAEIPKAVNALFPKIRVGDRLAAKKMIGPKDPSQIEIRALGIVIDIDPDEWRIYVEWIVPEMSRLVPIKGCMGSIHGPFEVSDWLSDVFRI
ncbi:hypothetical protein V0M98_17420 [Pseudomonas silesiensis]|uniref:hypothetical protein n=1 Tax=Pseudomonas silesiensis TaxID=1853130 RepID=UPI0030D12E43